MEAKKTLFSTRELVTRRIIFSFGLCADAFGISGISRILKN